MNVENSYLGRVAIILSIGMVICLLASLGYNTYLSITKERIEVRTSNSNSINDT